MLTLAKSYRFSAAHTLSSPHLTEEENRRTYGKCANPTGHGHDYVLEFRLSAAELADDVLFGHGQLDQLVRAHIAPHFDRNDLNRTFGLNFISSGENLAKAAHDLLAPHLPASITLDVCLIETEKNSFVYDGALQED